MTSLTSIQAQRTDYEKGKTDPKVSKANQSFEAMKKETPLLKEFVALATKYHSLLSALASTGQQMGSVLEKIAQCHEGDSQSAIMKVAEVHKQLDSGRNQMAEELMSKVIVPIGARSPEEFKEAMNWQKEYKKRRANSLSNIKKLENRAKSSQKKARKNPQIMEPILQSLEESINSHDKLLGDGLREIRTLERRRCCSLVEGWVDVIDVETEVLGICWDDLNNAKDKLRAFSGDKTNIGDADKVINDSRPNKTVEQIREARKTGYYDANQMAYLQDTLRMSTLDIQGMASGTPGLPPRGGPPSNGAPGLPSRPSSTNYNNDEEYYGEDYGSDG